MVSPWVDYAFQENYGYGITKMPDFIVKSIMYPTSVMKHQFNIHNLTLVALATLCPALFFLMKYQWKRLMVGWSICLKVFYETIFITGLMTLCVQFFLAEFP